MNILRIYYQKDINEETTIDQRKYSVLDYIFESVPEIIKDAISSFLRSIQEGKVIVKKHDPSIIAPISEEDSDKKDPSKKDTVISEEESAIRPDPQFTINDLVEICIKGYVDIFEIFLNDIKEKETMKMLEET